MSAPREASAADRRLNDAISDELLGRLEKSAEMAQIHHTVQVTSFGGAGTTALLRHLAEAGVDVPATPGSFPFKHQRLPPRGDEVPPGFRVVYLFADPRNAVASVFRRGFQGGHFRSMRLCRPSPHVEDCLTSLERYLECAVDEFRLADHFEGWHERRVREYPVLFARYERLPAAWPVLREFVGLPPGADALDMRPRASEWKLLPPPLPERLDETYGPLARRLAELPATELR